MITTASDITPLHKHEHPAYQWITLIISVLLVLSLVGWYYLVALDVANLENDTVIANSFRTVKSSDSLVTPVGKATEIDREINAIDVQLGGTSPDDFAAAELSDTGLGIAN